jgi:16S rRNA (uracil1498-N3)-methyltransferase
MSRHTFSFYLPSLDADASSVEIDGDEHRHLKRVLRLQPGTDVRVTNGRGLMVRALIDRVADNATTLAVAGVETTGEPARRVALALPLLQRAHFETAVSQAVEMGMTELVPVLAERRHVRAWGAGLAGRVERVIVTAIKQSGRAWLPPVREPVTVQAVVAMMADFDVAALGDMEGGPAPQSDGDLLAIVGPEAGFSEREEGGLLAAGVHRVVLSAHRLRAETAAVALLCALQPAGARHGAKN